MGLSENALRLVLDIRVKEDRGHMIKWKEDGVYSLVVRCTHGGEVKSCGRRVG